MRRRPAASNPAKITLRLLVTMKPSRRYQTPPLSLPDLQAPRCLLPDPGALLPPNEDSKAPIWKPGASDPYPCPPLPAPGGKPGDGTPTPPVLYAWSGHHIKISIYSVLSERGPERKHPRGMGPKPKKFKSIFSRRVSQRSCSWLAQRTLIVTVTCCTVAASNASRIP
jgi:hypothetical protein